MIVQELALDLKYTLTERLDAFTESAKDLMLAFDYYEMYYSLQEAILDAEEKFSEATKSYIKYALIN